MSSNQQRSTARTEKTRRVITTVLPIGKPSNAEARCPLRSSTRPKSGEPQPFPLPLRTGDNFPVHTGTAIL
ncbi:hypothetical protein HER10_EVM0000618 [Colletotrichum scovillei]|uniref:uncharacterized protein n=1 Tax=Colletotrichum scovillei TaxID=1209932 RepID=UPI0015C3539D|nr:uncharacterized protein HER10_EVM0000618 [Colletotrichum scovillei]KAF4777365.1 hypothetical protein HER10_EVM0000618 [Colletotrichum scovillei]